jgi:hypothetical protein
MAAPVVTELVAQPAIANSWAEVIEFRARATDADGNNTIRGVTFFRDHDENGVWTPGVDQDLGLVTERNGAGQYVKTPTPEQKANWPGSVQVVANAVDLQGNWGTNRNTSARLSAGASVTLVTLSVPILAPGQQSRVRVQTSGNVEAVTAFVDTNNDGRFSATNDISLGDSNFTVPGSPGTFEIPFTADIDWPVLNLFPNDIVPIVANARGAGNQWATAKAASQGLFLDSLPEVTRFEAYWAPQQQLVTFDGWTSDDAFKRNAVDGRAEVVTFFLDTNKNNRWDGSAVDIDVGFVVLSSSAFYIQLPANPNWPADSRFVATARDDRVLGDGWGQPRTAVPISSDAQAPNTTAIFVSPVIAQDAETGLVAGEKFRISAYVNNANRSLPVTAVFFEDKNANGIQDAGDLEVYRATDNADADGNANFSSPDITYSPGVHGVGFQRFGAYFISQGIPKPSAPYGRRVRFIEGPTAGNFSSSNIQIAAGQNLVFDLSAFSGSVGSSINGFIDLDNDGNRDFSDRSLATREFLGSTPGATRWRATFSTTGLAAGTYKVYLSAGDIEGMWGPRSFITVTIV